MSEKQANAQVGAVETQSGNYEKFCRRVGIWPMTDRAASHGPRGRSAKNKGTYEELINSQRKCRVEYYTTASLINAALFSQIIIAAAVTATSASSGPRVAITVLGALNTVIAGSLTWVKGQGLPDRLLAYANELRRVREHIEDLERQYEETPELRLDVDKEAKVIYTMYDNARKNAENAYVGTFQSISAEGLKGDWRTAKDRPMIADSTAPKAGGDTSGTADANGGVAQAAAENPSAVSLERL